MSGFRIVARSALATVCTLAAFAPLAGVAAAAQDPSDGPPFGNGVGNGPQTFQVEEPTDVPPDETTTTTAAAEEPPEPEPTTPPPTQPEQPPPTQPQQPPPTVTPTTSPSTTPTTRPGTTTTNPPATTTPPPPRGTTPTTARPIVRAPVIVFPTKSEDAVSSSTSSPGQVATTEPKTAVKTVPGADGGSTTTTDKARVAGTTQERGNGTGDLASSSFEDSSSSLLPTSTVGAMLLVALVGFLAAGAYCGWLLVFARR